MNFFSKTKKFKINKKENVIRFLTFLLGCFIVAIAYNIFLVPTEIVPGGVGGLAIIINTVVNVDNAIIILIADIILLVFSYFALGKELTKNSVLEL